MKIPFFIQEFTDEMEEAAIQALRNESFVGGESVTKFEEEFARYTGTKYAASVNSGNSALQISLMALGIGDGSKVITPTNSFIASANCIRMTNAEPILTDVDLKDGGIDLSKCKDKVNAIIPVHIYGNPCNFDSVKLFSEEQNIPIIEDACQAHGAEYKGKKVGSLGDVGCFSFYPTKNMTVGGDGGMATTDEKTTRRREIVSIYRKNLSQDCILPENKDGKSVYHQIVIKHEKRNEIRKELADNEIGSAIYYETPIHKQAIYEEFRYKLPNSEKFSKEIMSLPSYPQLTDEQALEICEHVNKVIG